jgi:phage-related protein
MDQQTLLTIFVGLAALAMLIQAVMLVVMGVVAVKLQQKIMPLLGPAQGILQTSKRMVDKVEGQVDRIGTSVESHVDKIGSSSSALLDKIGNSSSAFIDRVGNSSSALIEKVESSSSSILDTTKQQLVKVDELLSDATTRARSQMDRAEMVLDDTMTRVHQTVSTVQSGVLRPVREVQGFFAGVKGALSYLSKAGRPTVDHATSDEEMFI